MRKFTIFTFILTIVVVVVLGEMIVNEYLPNIKGQGKNNVLGADVLGATKLGADVEGEADSGTTEETERSNLPILIPPIEEENGGDLALDFSDFEEEGPIPLENDGDGMVGPREIKGDNVVPGSGSLEALLGGDAANGEEAADSGLKDFEDVTYVAPSSSVLLRQEQIKSAGFLSAYLQQEPADEMLFKSVPITDLFDTEVEKWLIRTDTELLAKVYVFKVGIQTEISEVYQLLKLRASEVLGVSVNETNQYGSASFYMNDPARENTAFLTVRIGAFVYAFSYPKDYHAQIKNLIQLLVWELG